jgi:hypothetical protein
VACALALTGCATPVCEGIIEDKSYEPRRTWTQFMPVGKVTVPQVRVDDEDYVLILHGFNGKDTVSYRHEVDSTSWASVSVGQHVIIPNCP